MIGLLPPQPAELPVNATTQPTAWYQNVLQTVAQAGQQYLTLRQQHELMQLQTERARMGLPPLDVSQYTPGVSVGVDSGTKKMLLIAAVILGAALVFRR